MLLRPEQPSDIPAITHLHDRAFGGTFESRLVETVRAGENFIPALSIVAVEGQQVVGHILCSRICIRGADDIATLALAPMAVLPEYQSRGTGSRLVTHGLEQARAAGYDAVVVLGHKEYYPRFGFRPASAWNIRCPFSVADEYFMALELRPGVLAAKAGVVEYPPEFTALE